MELVTRIDDADEDDWTPCEEKFTYSVVSVSNHLLSLCSIDGKKCFKVLTHH